MTTPLLPSRVRLASTETALDAGAAEEPHAAGETYAAEDGSGVQQDLEEPGCAGGGRLLERGLAGGTLKERDRSDIHSIQRCRRCRSG